VFSGALLVAVGGDTNTMIPLFAIGVFTGFTLSQAGLVVHWRRTRERGWARRSLINGLGALVTATATVIFLVTKFVEGAWVVVIAIPLLILLFHRIEVYYKRAGKEIGIDEIPALPERQGAVVVVPVSNISRLTQHTLSEALSLSDEVIAVTVVLDGKPSGLPERDVERLWAEWDPGIPLRVLHTDYASVVQPIVRLVDELLAEDERQVVVLIPVVLPERFRYRLLHNQTDLALATALHRRPNVIVARVPMAITISDPQEPPEPPDGVPDDHAIA
jgi:hypothetical protein